MLMRSARSTSRLVFWLVILTSGIFLFLTVLSSSTEDDQPSILTDSTDEKPAWHRPFRIPGLVGLGRKKSGKRRILVTGGSGVIGLPLVKRLIHDGHDISILDLRHPSPSDLAYLRNASTPSFDVSSFSPDGYTAQADSQRKLGKLSIITADVRHARQVQNVFKKESKGFEGIIHLAGVARNTWCSEREEECHRLNVEGTELIYQSAMEETKPDVRSPWFIYASSIDVYGYQGELGSGRMNALGKTKWAAEQAIRAAFDSSSSRDVGMGGSGRPPPATVILRHGTTFGSPIEFKDRLLPAIVERAMMEMPLQVMDADERIDLMRIEDAMDGFVGAINWAQRRQAEVEAAVQELAAAENEASGEPVNLEENKRQVGISDIWAEFDIVSGNILTPRELTNVVMAATRSSSPIQDYSLGREKAGPYRRRTPAVDPKLQTELGFKPRIPFEIGLAAYIHEQQAKFVNWSVRYLRDKCPGSKYGDPTVRPEADLRNERLDRLMGCAINMGVNYDGWIYHMKCGEEDGIRCQADNIKRNAYNWNQTVFVVVPPSKENISPLANDLLDRRRFAPRREDTENKLVVQFQEELTKKLLGFERQKGGAVDASQPIEFKLYTKIEAQKSEIVTQFEPRVQANASYLRLVVAGTNEFVDVVSQKHAPRFELAKLEDTSPSDIRMTTICCPTTEPWPLLLDDYETGDIKYGWTGDIPFNASLRMHECQRVEEALDFTLGKKKSQGAIDHDIVMHEEFTVDLAQKAHSVPAEAKPHEWKDRDYPVCMNDCSSPTICINNGECRCIQADDCPMEARNPIAPIAVSSHSRLIKITTNDDFAKAVDKISWKDLLLPEAKRVLEEFPDFIKVHVVSGYKGEDAIEALPCHKLGSNHCFSADSVMYRAMRKISVPAEEADLIILPAYQQCKGGPFLLHDIHSHAHKTIKDFVTRPKTVILTHDWGICISFAWNIWASKENDMLYPDPILDNIFVWAVQGDSNTKCYRPHQDVVIPARTCNSPKLKENFGSPLQVKPVSQRSVLITWSGTYWGTGKNTRLRLACERGGAGTKELIPNAGPQSVFLDWRYMSQLSGARFCPQPAGIAGWSFRVQDAIYAGCIPVFFADGTHYPFADVLDWSKFSVRLSSTDLDHVEDILRDIPIEKVEELQTNLVAIREAFLYSPDELVEDELTRRGPLFFALHSARIRLVTRYPPATTAASIS